MRKNGKSAIYGGSGTDKPQTSPGGGGPKKIKVAERRDRRLSFFGSGLDEFDIPMGGNGVLGDISTSFGGGGGVGGTDGFGGSEGAGGVHEHGGTSVGINIVYKTRDLFD